MNTIPTTIERATKLFRLISIGKNQNDGWLFELIGLPTRFSIGSTRMRLNYYYRSSSSIIYIFVDEPNNFFKFLPMAAAQTDRGGGTLVERGGGQSIDFSAEALGRNREEVEGEFPLFSIFTPRAPLSPSHHSTTNPLLSFSPPLSPQFSFFKFPPCCLLLKEEVMDRP
jgi:hypothetical protein